MIDWKTLPSLPSLRAFEAVARSGSFSGAARALNVTHAAISQNVRGLERELGVPLALRSGRSISLTDAGAALALALSDGFGTIAICIETLRVKEARRGLRVATTPFIVDAMIMPRLSEFWRDHPGTEISLQPSVHYVDLMAQGFDLGIRAAPEMSSWPGLEATLLARSQWTAVCAPSLVESGETDPLNLPWIWSDVMPGEIAALRHAGVDLEALSKTEVGSETLHWQATRRGIGVSLASEHVAREDIEAGRLVELELGGLPSSCYFAVTPKGPRRPVVDTFIDWLRAVFREGKANES